MNPKIFSRNPLLNRGTARDTFPYPPTPSYWLVTKRTRGTTLRGSRHTLTTSVGINGFSVTSSDSDALNGSSATINHYLYPKSMSWQAEVSDARYRGVTSHHSVPRYETSILCVMFLLPTQGWRWRFVSGGILLVFPDRTHPKLTLLQVDYLKILFKWGRILFSYLFSTGGRRRPLTL